VADHGMNDKATEDGTPNVIYLEEKLNARFGPNSVTVICPITDPFVRHHGALGSFVRGYLRSCRDLDGLMAAAASLRGVELVLDGVTASRRFELLADLEGDFIVCGDARTVIGSNRENHDLSGLAGHRLRSHGGLAEQGVPVILSRPMNDAHADRATAGALRNFDIFDLVLNGGH
jgi:phosphonoacetate hydrolase